jgi:hypothetical protein
MKPNHTDWRYLKIIGFFKSKDLLFVENITPYPRAKLWAEEIIWVAENIEPRVWEVLPAALSNYPKAFIDSNKLPQEILQLATAIKNNIPVDIKFKWINYQNAKRWADIEIKDKRVKIARERKRAKTFRLSPKALKALSVCASKMKISETEVLERLLITP